MARIKLVKASTSFTKRNTGNLLSKYLPYVNSIAISILTLKVLNII